jgi:hypothetical protein
MNVNAYIVRQEIGLLHDASLKGGGSTILSVTGSVPVKCPVIGTTLTFRVPVRSSILISFRLIMGLAQHNLSAIGGICRQLDPNVASTLFFPGTNDGWAIYYLRQQRKSLKTPTISAPQRWGRFFFRIRPNDATVWRQIDPCACRKSNPNILVMQPAQDRTAKNVPSSLNRARCRCILVQR